MKKSWKNKKYNKLWLSIKQYDFFLKYSFHLVWGM